MKNKEHKKLNKKSILEKILFYQKKASKSSRRNKRKTLIINTYE